MPQKFVKTALVLIALFFASKVPVGAQSIELIERNVSRGGNIYVGVEICAVETTGSGIVGGKRRSCSQLSLDDPEAALLLLEAQRLAAIQDAASRTSERVQSVDDKIVALGSKIDALTTQIETSHNNQLVAIRDQIIAKLETLPLLMIDDEAVVREIRALVVEEVEAAFDRRD